MRLPPSSLPRAPPTHPANPTMLTVPFSAHESPLTTPPVPFPLATGGCLGVLVRPLSTRHDIARPPLDLTSQGIRMDAIVRPLYEYFSSTPLITSVVFTCFNSTNIRISIPTFATPPHPLRHIESFLKFRSKPHALCTPNSWVIPEESQSMK